MDVELPQGVGWTALVTAHARAQESRRPDRLFDDVWARAVIAQATRTRFDAAGLPVVGPAIGEGSSALWRELGSYVVVRTPFYDEHVQLGVADGCRQVVLLAAGFDGRAARLDLPEGTTVFELDTAAVLDFKNAALNAEGVAGPNLARRRTVAADLRGDWPTALVDAGFDPRRPTVWLAEGLLMYLDGDECDRLLEDITALSTSGSRFVTEWAERNPAGERSLVGYPDEAQRHAGELLGSLFRSGPVSPPREWLDRHGWYAYDIDHVGARYHMHGRDISWFFDPSHPDGLRIHLVAGTRAI